MMIGLLHDELRDGRRGPHAFERRHAAGALLGAVHARGIELHDTLGVRQSAVADAGVLRIELENVDAGDQRVEHVRAARDHGEGPFDRRLRAAVLVTVAVGGRDHDRLDALWRQHGGGLREQRPRRGGGYTRGSGGSNEVAPIECCSHQVLTVRLKHVLSAHPSTGLS
jgi:hypothetical protein